GFNQKSVVIVGAGKLGVRACTSMQREAWAGLFPVAFFDDKEALQGSSINNVMIQGQLADVTNYIEEQRQLNRKSVDQVWIALPLSAQEAIEGLQLALQDTATNVYFVPDLYGFNLASYDVGEVVGLPVMNMSAPLINGTTANIKRLEDIVLSAILLLVLSPVMLVCALLIKRESSGPILFKQRRYGMHGEEIIVWKFRSMTVAEDGAQVSQASRNDTRVTRVGKILRQTSLDELPQLINVLQGKMSLVGPRPHAVAHNEFYRKKVKGYMMRHQVRPGITGWAQVNGCRGETNDIADMEERVHFDLEYIRNCSIFMDLRILFLTVNTVLNTQDTY
ncbi:MAG: putative colanic acid biosynthesis UDP-glucose lipid carrier transferase, partial [Arenicella sp.]